MVYTIGHSVLPIEAFLKLLKLVPKTSTVVDVRSSPRSRRPWFNQDKLKAAIESIKLRYDWIPELGGRQTVNFRVYMRSLEFSKALKRLHAYNPPVLLCAEADAYDCHRWLIANALTVDGITVKHIHHDGELEKHTDKGE